MLSLEEEGQAVSGAAAVNTATSCHGGQDGVLWVDQRERENFFVI